MTPCLRPEMHFIIFQGKSSSLVSILKKNCLGCNLNCPFQNAPNNPRNIDFWGQQKTSATWEKWFRGAETHVHTTETKMKTRQPLFCLEDQPQPGSDLYLKGVKKKQEKLMYKKVKKKSSIDSILSLRVRGTYYTHHGYDHHFQAMKNLGPRD